MYAYCISYGAVLSMVPHTRLHFQLLCVCPSTSLPFVADEFFSLFRFVATAIFVLNYITAAALFSDIYTS